MTNDGNNTDDFSSEGKLKPFDFTKYLPPHIHYDIKMSEIYTDFVLNFLAKKKGVGKIDQLLLKENGIVTTLKRFIEKQDATKYGYAEIIKQTDKYIKLKITQNGISHFKTNSTKYRIKLPTLIKRITLYVLKLTRKFWLFVFISANNKIKVIMESGIIKLILFIIALITFIMKWDDIKRLIHKLTE